MLKILLFSKDCVLDGNDTLGNPKRCKSVRKKSRKPVKSTFHGLFCIRRVLGGPLQSGVARGIFGACLPTLNTRYPCTALTHLQVQKEKLSDKPRKLADGGGLYLLVNQAGKHWRWKYRFEGKEKVMALGVYPDVSLAEAREAHQAARKLLASGTDPMAERKQQTLAPAGAAFMQVACQW
ncbi:Arm DNA-binding domain-containing protein [Ralstonia nicotianae]|nr:Arm DNA-binding domain-containing protein [Ralstonia pseudosolanacearum]MDK1380981.1 Arm DNA-binding domain-containing protein [Ralstonia pseudosolanacearum]